MRITKLRNRNIGWRARVSAHRNRETLIVYGAEGPAPSTRFRVFALSRFHDFCKLPFARLRHVAMAMLAAALLVACGNDGPENGENYGNLLLSPGGLIVLEEEHPTGWGRPDCQACHERRSSHIENRTGLASCDEVPSGTTCIDLEAIQNLIRAQGNDSCGQCHGDNGAPS